MNLFSKLKRLTKTHVLAIFMLCGILIGQIVGGLLIYLKPEGYSSREVMYVGYLGELFIRILQGTAYPLKLSCVVSCFDAMDLSLITRIGLLFTLYVTVILFQVTLLAVMFAITLSYADFHKRGSIDNMTTDEQFVPMDAFIDLIRNVFPTDFVQMNVRHYSTAIVKPKNGTSVDIREWEVIRGNMEPGANMLGIVAACVMAGIALAINDKNTYHIQEIMSAVTKILLKITRWYMCIAPVGMASLIAKAYILIQRVNTINIYLMCLVVYVVTLLFQSFIIFPLIYYIFIRKNPIPYIFNLSEALLVAAVTGSSNLAGPALLDGLIVKNKIDAHIAKFIEPMGGFINMTGTAMFIAIFTIFTSYKEHRILTVIDILLLIMCSMFYAMAASPVPGSGMLALITVIHIFHLPKTYIPLIYAMDAINERLRTPVNVLGNGIGAAILEKYSIRQIRAATTYRASIIRTSMICPTVSRTSMIFPSTTALSTIRPSISRISTIRPILK